MGCLSPLTLNILPYSLPSYIILQQIRTLVNLPVNPSTHYHYHHHHKTNQEQNKDTSKLLYLNFCFIYRPVRRINSIVPIHQIDPILKGKLLKPIISCHGDDILSPASLVWVYIVEMVDP